MVNLDMNRPLGVGQGWQGDFTARVVSAIVLVAAAVTFNYAGLKPFAFLVVFAVVLMAWEWGRLVRASDLDAAHIVHAATVTAASIVAALGGVAIALMVLLVGAIAILLLRLGERALLSAFGVVHIGLPAVALLWLRADEAYGFAAVLLVFFAVWATDTFAFVTGRTFAGPKLWPAVSPNKTWSGLIGGVTAAGLCGTLFAQFVTGASPLALGGLGLLLGIVSQGGDLIESALKRRFGVKDSSNLIPGHGGVLDRLDGMITAATAAGLVGLLVDPTAPARALLLGH